MLDSFALSPLQIVAEITIRARVISRRRKSGNLVQRVTRFYEAFGYNNQFQKQNPN